MYLNTIVTENKHIEISTCIPSVQVYKNLSFHLLSKHSSTDLLIVVIPSSGHGDGIVLNHLERTTAMVQIRFLELNFSVIHIPAAAANKKGGNSNDRTGNHGHSTGRGDVVILILAGGVGHPGGNMGLAIANEVGAIFIRINQQLGDELFPRQEPILVAPRWQSVRRSEAVRAILGAVAVPAAGPRAQIDRLGFAVLVERVLVGDVVDLGISRGGNIETDFEHGVGRGGIHSAEGVADR